MSKMDQKETNGPIKEQSKATPKISRRTLIRSAAVGMPAVLTLHPGAALARSSNMVGAAPPGTKDRRGNTLCLDTRTAEKVVDSNQVDLGEPARARVNILSDRAYYQRGERRYWWSRPRPQSADAACNKGGTYYYRDNGWHKVELPRNGMIVSATAMVSVSLRGDVHFNRIA